MAALVQRPFTFKEGTSNGWPARFARPPPPEKKSVWKTTTSQTWSFGKGTNVWLISSAAETAIGLTEEATVAQPATCSTRAAVAQFISSFPVAFEGSFY